MVQVDQLEIMVGITSHKTNSVGDQVFAVGGVPKIIFRQIAVMNLAKAAKSELYE